MNLQNIIALADQMKFLGFGDFSSSLLKRICFKPKSFVLVHKIKKGADLLNFHLFIEKDVNQNVYILKHYDVNLQKEIALPDTTINGVNITNLQKHMSDIDWSAAFKLDETKLWNLESRESWEMEQKIEVIINDLTTLEDDEYGKGVSMDLKIKYWNEVSYQGLVGNINLSKSKSEVSQRFYFLEGESGISVDEAYRFLQSRWLEKQMQTKRKQGDNKNENEVKHQSTGTVANGGFQKKRLKKLKVQKNNS